jgi:hypothetical protein
VGRKGRVDPIIAAPFLKVLQAICIDGADNNNADNGATDDNADNNDAKVMQQPAGQEAREAMVQTTR